jgi:hypothetical protein
MGGRRGRGKLVRSPIIGAVLMTGEFVRERSGEKSRVFKIVDVCQYAQLSNIEQRLWALSDKGDFVLAQWCVVVGDVDGEYAESHLALKDKARAAGLREIVLRQKSSWYPIEYVVDAVIVLPAVTDDEHEVNIKGMDNAYIMGFEEQAGGALSLIDPDSVGAFPEENLDLGRDHNGKRLLHHSRTSKLWMIIQMLRDCIFLLMRASLRLLRESDIYVVVYHAAASFFCFSASFA